MPSIPSRKALRVLVIGAGPATTDLHLPVLARLRDRQELELALVCDLQSPRAEAARRTFGFAEHTGDGIAALARTDIDVIYLFGSARLHHEYGLQALRAGKHLFVEKPAAPSYEAANELALAARRHGVVAVAGHNRRFYSTLNAAQALAGNARWRFAEAVFHKPEFGREPAFGARTWLGANGIHALDALLFMMKGMPEQLWTLSGEAGAATPAMFSALMRWPDGAQGVFLCNNNAGGRREAYAFHGPGHTCRIDDEGLTVESSSGRSQTPAPPFKDSIAAEHEAFLHSIREGVEAPHAIAAVAPSLLLCELIERGYCGPVSAPATGPAELPARASAPRSLLVVQPGEMQEALAHLPAHTRMVSMADVQSSEVQRPDVAAAILGRGAEPLPPDVLAKLPNLGVIGVVGLSLARHDVPALLARGITVVNASQAYAESVAEFALGLAILGRRRAFESHALMRDGGWGTRPAPRLAGLARVARKLRPLAKAAGMENFLLRQWRARGGAHAPGVGPLEPRELRGATVGLLGWSANACAFARRLQQAQARVLAWSEHARDTEFAAAGATRASLWEVLAADIVSLHRGLTPGTRHFLGAAELEKLRPGTVLINIARGALIEPAALLARLQRGDVFACLDTFEIEPPAARDPLRSLPNVFLTSHIAGGSRDMHAAAAREVVQKIASHLAGNAVEAISAERLRTMS